MLLNETKAFLCHTNIKHYVYTFYPPHLLVSKNLLKCKQFAGDSTWVLRACNDNICNINCIIEHQKVMLLIHRDRISVDCFFVAYLTMLLQWLRLYSVTWRGDKWMTNWKRRGRKWCGLILTYYPSICLEVLRNIMETSIRIAGLWAEISTRNLLNTKQKC
jgi:hypothetical protein